MLGTIKTNEARKTIFLVQMKVDASPENINITEVIDTADLSIWMHENLYR